MPVSCREVRTEGARDHVSAGHRDGRRPRVTELFPISSLGQAVILPPILGWDHLVEARSQSESFFLAFLVGMHVATSTALLIYYRSDWRAIIREFFRTLGEGARSRKATWSAIHSNPCYQRDGDPRTSGPGFGGRSL